MARDEVLDRAEKDYERFKNTHSFEYPSWLMVLLRVN